MPSREIQTLGSNRLSHLQRLEAESIHVMREVAAEFANPVMLYSIGKDSSVMLHLAMKAFYPSKPPFPLLHIDTTWKFREMIAFRDETAKRLGLKLIVYVNEDGVRRGISAACDIAMTRLFGGFGTEFHAAYAAHWPLMVIGPAEAMVKLVW